MRYKQVNLYHYSNRDIKGNIQVKYFGDNSYTKNDIKACNIKRAFYYIGKSKIEYTFNYSKYLYITKVNKNKLYNLDIDKKKLKEKFTTKNLDIVDITKLLKHIKKRYTGVIYNNNIACVFNDIPYTKKIKRG